MVRPFDLGAATVHSWIQIVVTLTFLIGGCSGAPSRIKPPQIDPGSAASQAFELYDTNHDGKLNQEELAKCPGVLVSLKRYDTNGDQAIDQDEFQSRLANLLKSRAGATQLTCVVSYQGKPLSGAKVAFEPEPYLGSDIPAAEGVTGNNGSIDVSMPPEKVPATLKGMKLINYGTFKVRITHPTTKIPEKYNNQTTLGYETIPGEPLVNFALK